MKKIIILLCVMLLSGCTARVDLIIDNKEKISEKTQIYLSEKHLKMGEKKEEFIKKEIEQQLLDIGYSNPSFTEYSKNYDQNTRIVTLTKSSTVENYFSKDSIFNNMFRNVNFENKGNTRKLKANGLIKYEPQAIDSDIVEGIDINIKVPFKVLNHNADSVYQDIYTYKINANDTDKEIILEYTTSKQLSKFSYGLIITFIALIIILLVYVAFIYLKFKKKNTF